MEAYVPPITPPERAPEPETEKPKQLKRNWFELFKRREDEPTPEQKASPEKPDAQAEKRGEVLKAPDRRRFAADIMMIIRGEQLRSAPVAKPEAPVAAVEHHEKPTPEVAKPEVLQPPIIERAKEVGRGVLRLIGRVRGDVEAADRREHVAVPTDFEPLVAADADVRAAMQELIAPIEELELAQGHPPIETVADPEHDAVLDKAVGTSPEGGDGGGPRLDVEKSPLTRTFEVVAAVAEVAAREALDAKERITRRMGRARKIGVFALGAASAGGFAYTWQRLRQIKKEQRELRREHQRFEAEVRAMQAAEETRLHELEATNVDTLSQPQRQQFVEEVSTFAHQQAAEIRSTARYQQQAEVAQRHTVNRTEPAGSKPEVAFTPQERTETVRNYPEKPPLLPTPEHNGLIDRLSGVVRRARDGEGVGVTRGIAAASSKLVSAFGRKKQPQDDDLSKGVTPAQPQKTTQAWLLSAALGLGIIIVILFMTGIL